MSVASSSIHFILLADESAEWKVAGLRQLDRVARAVNEFCSDRQGARLQIVWKLGLAVADWEMPPTPHVHIETVKMAESHLSGACLLSTHLLIDRGGMASLYNVSLTSTAGSASSDLSWDDLAESFRSWSVQHQNDNRLWRPIWLKDDIARAERDFLRGAGKSQDGLVSRFLNRPISRSVTRFLLRYPISPTQWTVAIFVLPVISFFLLQLGDYGAILLGTALFQLFSILDGCDGEIARAKYSESEAGGRLDHVCDQAGNILFLVGLGLGLFHRYHPATAGLFYWREAVLCAALITVHELVLGFSRRQATVVSAGLTPALYRRHRWMIEHSGIGLFGEKFVWWLMQLTKRDVSILAFLFLVMADLPQWILHLWLTVTLGGIILTGMATLRARRNRVGTV